MKQVNSARDVLHNTSKAVLPQLIKSMGGSVDKQPNPYVDTQPKLQKQNDIPKIGRFEVSIKIKKGDETDSEIEEHQRMNETSLLDDYKGQFVCHNRFSN